MNKLGHIAYHKTEGKAPTVVFCGGFKSDMTGTKAVFLESVCKEIGQGFVRFDYSGHGSSGGKFEDGTIGLWLSDALKVIDELTSGEIILVGSSMGGWIALLAAIARPERVKGIVGVASAPDFTEDLIWNALSEKQKQEVLQNGKTMIPNCYADQAPYPITLELIEEGRKHLLLTPHAALDAASKTPHQVRGVIAVNCPIRLIHGMMDEDVPYQYSEKIANAVTSQNVEVTYIKNGNHRLSEPKNLQLLKEKLLGIINL